MVYSKTELVVDFRLGNLGFSFFVFLHISSLIFVLILEGWVLKAVPSEPKGPQRGPKRPQGIPKRLQGAPRGPQEAPRRHSGNLKRPQEIPRDPQEALRETRETQRDPQETPFAQKKGAVRMIYPRGVLFFDHLQPVIQKIPKKPKRPQKDP